MFITATAPLPAKICTRSILQKIGHACAVALMLAYPHSPAAAAEAASAWVEGPLSKVRLISGGLTDGVWQAGVEISLKSEAHTYWRNPGDSGVPPTFDFAGSKNMKSVSIRYPAPARMEEAGMQIYGYKSEVIFPLSVIAEDAQKPVVVQLHLNFAACEKICMPAEAKLSFEFDPRIDGGALKARIADYEALVPKPLEGPGAPQLKISALPDREKKSWRVALTPMADPEADLFAQGPEGWFFDTKRIADGSFELVLAEKPADAPLKLQPVTLTLTTGKGAFEVVRHLDAGTTTP